MNSVKNKINELIGELRAKKQEYDNRLEKALQEREDILASPIPKQEIKDNFNQAVDDSAKRFEEALRNLVHGRARRRKAIGVQRTPEVIRKQGSYSELNIDAINFFLGDIIKSKVSEFIDELDYFGLDDGLSDEEHKKLLNKVEAKIDDIKIERDSLVEELNSILK